MWLYVNERASQSQPGRLPLRFAHITYFALLLQNYHNQAQKVHFMNIGLKVSLRDSVPFFVVLSAVFIKSLCELGHGETHFVHFYFVNTAALFVIFPFLHENLSKTPTGGSTLIISHVIHEKVEVNIYIVI